MIAAHDLHVVFEQQGDARVRTAYSINDVSGAQNRIDTLFGKECQRLGQTFMFRMNVADHAYPGGTRAFA
jgi:hypothetical protein